MDPFRRAIVAAISFTGLELCFPMLSRAAEGIATLPELAIILDDAGNSKSGLKNLERLAKKNVPVTVAVLPGLNYTNEALSILSGYENADIFLHQPMEPKQMYERGVQNGLEANLRKKNDTWDKDKHTAIYGFDSPDDIHMMITRNLFTMGDYLDDLGYDGRIVGMNNHMGSLVTENPELCHEIANTCKENGLILLDSVTSGKSKLYPCGKALGVKTYRRNESFFPANSDTNKSNSNVCYKELQRIIERANILEPTITIGHVQYSGCIDGLIEFSKGYGHMLKRMSELK